MSPFLRAIASVLIPALQCLQGVALAQSAPQAEGGGALHAAGSLPAGTLERLPASEDGGMPAPRPGSGEEQEYRIGPNDLLDVDVLDLERGKRTVRVNAAGSITLPLVGGVTVAGLTQEQAERRIADLYGEKYLQDPQVSLFIREFTTERITIDGAVAKPGIYPLTGTMTLLRALALAGGFGPLANAGDVKIFRQEAQGGQQVETHDVHSIRAGSAPDPVIRGDDLVVVQRDSTRAMLKDSVFRDVLDSLNPFSVFR